jgi:hypothetical protein
MPRIILVALSIASASILPAVPLEPSQAAVEALSNGESDALREIWRLDRAISSWERRCGAAARGAKISMDDLERDAHRLVRALVPLEAHAASAASEDGGALRRKVASLRSKLRTLEAFSRAGDAARCSTPVTAPRSRPRAIEPGVECRGATPLGEETVAWRFPAATADWADPVAGEAWLRVDAARSGSWQAHTRGSTADTDIAVFDTCADGAPALAFDDDTLGLQSAVGFETASGESRWLRVRQRNGAAYDPVVLTVRGAGGGISGVVTESATGSPIPDTYVRIYERNTGNSVASAWAGPDGVYVVTGLDTGTYVARTRFSYEHLDELWDDRPCHEDCDVTQGDPIPVLDERVTSGIDFALLRAGAISGRLRSVETGEALADYRVSVQSADGSSGDSDHTDAAGRYTVGGLGPGLHFVWTDGSEYRNEVYDDIPCLPYCQPEDGTPVPVVAEETTADVDFDLHALGSISGDVTEASSGAPIPFASLTFYDAFGNSAGWADADATGHYVGGGLEGGVYFVVSDAYGGYRNEVYDDVPCTGTGSGDCEPLSGTPVPVSLGDVTPGIDFALDRLGALAGQVVDELSATAIPNVRERAWTASGQFAGDGWTNPLGIYVVEDLAAGSYFVTTENDEGYLDELYDDLPCPGWPQAGCDPTSGTPIDVVLEEVTPGIDFALTPGGAVAGALIDALTGDPIENRYVDLWNATGAFAGDAYTDSAGGYYLDTLPGGTYFLSSQTFGDYLDELYDDIPCPGGAPGGCNPTTGTPIVVAVGTATQGVDLSLSLRGGLSGMVASFSGQPLPGVGIDVWDDTGSHVATTATNAGGAYQVDLSSGFFYVSTDAGQGYTDEIWDDVTCPDGPAILGLCDPLTGMLVEVIGAEPAVTGIDFELASPIFADGFESGDTTAWSATVP